MCSSIIVDTLTSTGKKPSAKKTLDELERIYSLSAPYDQLRHINPLIEQIQKINIDLIEDKRNHGLSRVNERVDRVTSALSEASAPAELQNKALYPLQQLNN